MFSGVSRQQRFVQLHGEGQGVGDQLRVVLAREHRAAARGGQHPGHGLDRQALERAAAGRQQDQGGGEEGKAGAHGANMPRMRRRCASVRAASNFLDARGGRGYTGSKDGDPGRRAVHPVPDGHGAAGARWAPAAGQRARCRTRSGYSERSWPASTCPCTCTRRTPRVSLQELQGLTEGRAGVLEQDLRFFRRTGPAAGCGSPPPCCGTPPAAPRLVFALGKDVTRWKHSERQMRLAVRQAEETTRTKSQFLANMSHEIRTPIHTITGMSELLLETSLDAEQKEYAGQIRFAAEVLLSLVNDVLDFSKIEAGRLMLESADFDLRTVVEEAVDLLSLEAHRKGLELAVFVDPRLPVLLRGDPVRLRQIMVNLLSQRREVHHRGGDRARLPARASGGAGLPGARHGHRDERAAAGQPLPPLPAGRRLHHPQVRRHRPGPGDRPQPGRADGRAHRGGKRARTRAPPSGSPAGWRGSPARSSGPTHRGSSWTGTAVLVVDDNAAARRAARGYLEAWGCQVAEAGEAAGALEAMRAAAAAGAPFRVALLDQRLPGADGWQLAGEINRDTAINDASLVLLSPAGLGGVEAKMRLLGWVDAYLTKPLKSRELAAALLRCVGDVTELEAVEEAEEVGAGPDGARLRPAALAASPGRRGSRGQPGAGPRCCWSAAAARWSPRRTAPRPSVAATAGAFDLIFLDLQMPVPQRPGGGAPACAAGGAGAARRHVGQRAVAGARAVPAGRHERLPAQAFPQERRAGAARPAPGGTGPIGAGRSQRTGGRRRGARATAGAAAKAPSVFESGRALEACLGDRRDAGPPADGLPVRARPAAAGHPPGRRRGGRADGSAGRRTRSRAPL